MLKSLLNQEVSIYFTDGSYVRSGTLEEVGEQFIRYKDEYEMLYVPLTAIRYVSVNTKERDKPKVGFTPTS
ncbi:hypothetical protein OHJ21_14205 [Virgibacillus sp. LDC1]|jgi:hypothetical protein|uniref:hypothetical protein n=1 Tax=Paenibacillus TaxID=44249 RepID=UPI000C280EE7|nr:MULTISPECIES: hypothetical protein [Paenibacillus]MCV4232333.1 hypothetical protein [Virgibacillus sp. LDC1]MEC0201961.1 hypothetical protein [Paenibacillus lautus]MEC0257375.1 hypothetical protein [Paenibacillus lautus]MEC0308185.1 hypothetical protein [Paenibacillus lautus]PJN56319.1 hypothetical protein PAEVO_30420 [Paenibacillus sp. GM2FR]